MAVKPYPCMCCMGAFTFILRATDAFFSMSPTATATRGKHKLWIAAEHMSIKDPQTAAQKMGCQMEEIKFEYANEEEQA